MRRNTFRPSEENVQPLGVDLREGISFFDTANLGARVGLLKRIYRVRASTWHPCFKVSESKGSSAFRYFYTLTSWSMGIHICGRV